MQYIFRNDVGQITEVNGQEQSSAGVECNNGNTCNGKRFVECIPDYHTNPAEWGDLVDFIECKPEKDYISWLKKRHKYNKWKEERTMTTKHQKRKRQILSIKKVYNLRAR
ncbi:hypothetical protein HPP92_000172 [Vanilla planifolia]|uniref:Uncharacterized protein n=1 Tax=Vanilla planifolia TaxID=51239 RepID=A0A835S4B9_VANPL|nr:hypothetical protein HPP92_000172 [Vanilla planifolia]